MLKRKLIEGSLLMTKAKSPVEWLITRHAALFLGCSIPKVRRLIAQGKLKARKSWGLWHVESKSLDTYAKSRPITTE